MRQAMRDYTYSISWSADDNQWVGLCLELPSLRHLADRPGVALDGIFGLVDMTVDDMRQRGETPPIPGCHITRAES